MLKLENITWSLEDGRGILNDVSLEIPDSKLVVITGPNGRPRLQRLLRDLSRPNREG